MFRPPPSSISVCSHMSRALHDTAYALLLHLLDLGELSHVLLALGVLVNALPSDSHKGPRHIRLRHLRLLQHRLLVALEPLFVVVEARAVRAGSEDADGVLGQGPVGEPLVLPLLEASGQGAGDVLLVVAGEAEVVEREGLLEVDNGDGLRGRAPD
jgi:hypothetical protein